MVRAYKTNVPAKTLNLKTRDYEVNPEILYKGMILRARITEIPAHLDWTEQKKMQEEKIKHSNSQWIVFWNNGSVYFSTLHVFSFDRRDLNGYFYVHIIFVII